MKQFNDLINNFWSDYAALVLLAGGVLGVVALISLAVWAKKSKKPLRPIALSFSMNLALLLNAEGMWVIATGQLHLPKLFAVLVFAVFEICFLTATSLAAEQYRRTTVYEPDGTIASPGHPGPMLWIAALIAGVSGIIVASNAQTNTERLLRLAVPCVIFLMWWAALTAAGQRVRRGRFAYSPRRLAERWGWLIPDDDPDLVRMASERQVRRMVVNHHRVSSARWPKSWWRNRLLKDARTANEPVVAEVVQQLARIQRVMDLLIPGSAPRPVPVLPLEAAAPAEPVTAEPGQVPAQARPVQPLQFVSPTPENTLTTVPGTTGVPAPRRHGENGVLPGDLSAIPGAPVPGDPTAVPGAVPAVLGSITGALPTIPVPLPPQAGTPLPPQEGTPLPPGAPVPSRPVAAAAPGMTVPPRPVPVPPVPAVDPSTAYAVASVLANNGTNGNGANGRGPAAPPPAWATTPTGSRPAVNVVGSPWWRLAVEGLARMVADEITPENLPDMTYQRVGELARNLAPRVSGLGEGVVRAFVIDYVREMNGEPGEAAYPWRDLLPQPAAARVGSEVWMEALQQVSEALNEELLQGDVRDARELAAVLAPSMPRLDEATIRDFIGDYLLALSGQPNAGADQPYQHLLPRAQGGRGPSDEEVLDVYGEQLIEHLRSTGKLTQYKVRAVTGVKGKVQLERIRVAVEERAAETAPA
ncbi:MFS transporter [Actinoplanes sp. NPDC051851]|uniref:MFS transporter n=1 Tax=Actinoplanes sp. NPDC051851 TaxID=3154753 RepID=UPI003443F22A